MILRKFLPLTFLLFGSLALIGQNLIPNPSFESWSGKKPIGWNSLSIGIFPLSIVKKTPDAQDGNFAAQLISKKSANLTETPIKTLPGFLVTGKVNAAKLLTLFSGIDDSLSSPESLLPLLNSILTEGVSISETPNVLEGYYKYTPIVDDPADSLADRCLIAALLFKTDGIDSLKRLVAIGVFSGDSASSYRHFSVPIFPLPSETPEEPNEMFILALSSVNMQSQGAESILWIDNLSAHKTASLSETAHPEAKAIRVYPNPSQGKSRILLDHASEAEITLFNILGEKCAYFPRYNLGQEIEFPHSGVFFVRVTTDLGTTTHRVVVTH